MHPTHLKHTHKIWSVIVYAHKGNNLWDGGRQFTLFPNILDEEDIGPPRAFVSFSFLYAGFPCKRPESDLQKKRRNFILKNKKEKKKNDRFFFFKCRQIVDSSDKKHPSHAYHCYWIDLRYHAQHNDLCQPDHHD